MHLREDAVKGMTKLVKECLDLAQSKQRRFFACWFGQVHDNADVRTMVETSLVDILLLEVCHPSSALFAGAREEVGIKDSQECSVGIENLVGFYVWMIDLDVGLQLERDAVKFGGKTENSFLDVLQLEVGTKHFAIDVVLLELQFVTVVGPIPRH